MCEFISAVEKRGQLKFLTGDIIQSARFKEMAKLRMISPDDYNGHGAIRAYFGIDEGDGVNKEYTDFSSPANFPDVIVGAIKDGKMRGMGTASGLLLDAVSAKWQPERDAVSAKWQPELDAVNAKWQAERDAVNAKWQPERDAVIAKFWDFFADPSNRARAWR